MADEPIQFAAEEFALWKHHPVTKTVLKFAVDYATVLERMALEKWRDGSLSLVTEQEMRGRVLATREISELSFEAIASFYRKEDEE